MLCRVLIDLCTLMSESGVWKHFHAAISSSMRQVGGDFFQKFGEVVSSLSFQIELAFMEVLNLIFSIMFALKASRQRFQIPDRDTTIGDLVEELDFYLNTELFNK